MSHHRSRSTARSIITRLVRAMPALAVVACAVCPPLAVAARTEAIPAPFPMPALRLPVFPDREISIVAHQAVEGGEHLNTAAIQNAIDACSRAGGGRVRVPKGRWLTGPLELKSRVNLHLEVGAVLLFTTEKKYYFGSRSVSAAAEWAQHGLDASKAARLLIPQPLISAFDCEDIAITGEGTVDGQGAGWWPLHPGWWRKARNDVPDPAAVEAEAWRGLDRSSAPQRPRLIQPIRCRNVLLEGFTAIDGPFWMINPVGCENVVMRGLTVRAAWRGENPDTPNTDGINPESCRNVLVEDCTIDTGDDSIAIKSGLDESGRRRGMPCENIVIRRVRAIRIAIGSEMSGGVRNVLIRDCELGGSNTILKVKTRRGRGGVVENIWLENIRAGTFFEGLVKVDMEYWTHVEPAPPEPLSERTPRFRNLYFSNIHGGFGTGNAVALVCNGLPEAPVENVVFRNIEVTAPRGVVCNATRGIRFEQVSIHTTKGPAISFQNSANVEFRSLALTGAGGSTIELIGRDNRDIQFDASSRLPGVDLILKDGARSEMITFHGSRK